MSARLPEPGQRAADQVTLDAASLDFMFPCRFELDWRLRLVRPGPGLTRLLPDLAEEMPFQACFLLDIPLELGGGSHLRRQEVMLTARHDRRLKLRGVAVEQSDGRLMFLVTPVLQDNHTTADLGIDPSCLSPFDGSAEIVGAADTQRQMAQEAQKLAERLEVTRDAALAQKDFFDAVIQMLPTILMVKDASDGRYVLVNRSAEEILGFSAEDMLGKSVFDLFPEEEARVFAEEDAEVIRSREMIVVEDEETTTASSGRRHFRTKKVATYGPEGARHVVTVGEDVTEQWETAAKLEAALAAAEQAAKAKTVFLANMSHEIRTPLNGIVAVADILNRGELTPRARDLVEIIRSSGLTLERLLSDILDQARIESGLVALETAPFHLGEAVRAAAGLAEMKAREKGVAVRVQLSPQIDGLVLGDMVRVRQVLTNLLSNAVKFTDFGQVSLTAERTAGGAIRFDVTDTGLGFDAATRGRIFSRFQQADSSITRKFGGTGLGLAISRELAELMGGALDCESEPGRGSRFWFEVPLSPAVGAAPAVAAAQPGTPNGALRVLVADDHPTNRRVIELMLEGQAEVTCVENGAEALEALKGGGFDLVLMDMQMPVMDGLTAIRRYRAGEPAETRLPIVMLTANALPDHVAASLEAGADRHLDKPITAASLFAAIGEVLSVRPAEAAA